MDLIEGQREITTLQEAKYKAIVTQHYNPKAKRTQFGPGDLVLRKNKANKVEGQKKLDPNWERPYKIEEGFRS